jgi:hypothetical protein
MHLHHRNDEPDALEERLGETGAHALDCLGALLPSLMCNLSRRQHLLDLWQAITHQSRELVWEGRHLVSLANVLEVSISKGPSSAYNYSHQSDVSIGAALGVLVGHVHASRHGEKRYGERLKLDCRR